MINITDKVTKCVSIGGAEYTHLQSISLPVAASVIMSRTHGGGVMGRRSYEDISYRLFHAVYNILVPCLQTRTCVHVEAVGQRRAHISFHSQRKLLVVAQVAWVECRVPKVQVLPPLGLDRPDSLVVDLSDLGYSGRCMEELTEVVVVADDTAAKSDIERAGPRGVGMDLRS